VLSPDEKRIKSLVGEIAAGGQSVTIAITYLDDPSVPPMASCPNMTVLNDIPLKSTDPTSGTRTFIVSGWDKIMQLIQDSYPWITNKGEEQCMTTDGWHYNSDANPNPTVVVTLGN
jgi:hypothetical protein